MLVLHEYFWNMSLDHEVSHLCVSEEKTNQLLKREGKIDRFPNKYFKKI